MNNCELNIEIVDQTIELTLETFPIHTENTTIVQYDDTGLQSELDLKASITQLNDAIANLVNSSPATLDTLAEIADALGDDSNFATTITTLIGNNTSAISELLPTKTADTGTEINLGNIAGNVCNMGSANTTATYTLTGSVDFGNAKVLINRADAPTITGATLIKGSDFIASTNMYMSVWNNGTRVEYWFEQIAI